MGERKTLGQKIAGFQDEVQKLAEDFDQLIIEETAIRLEGFSFAPPVVTSIEKFLRFDRRGLLDEIDRIVSLPDSEACAMDPDTRLSCDDIKVQHISVLVFYYKKLLELRRGNVEEWDEIDELYIHD